MQSFTPRPADWEDLPAFKHIARTTLTEDIPALFDPNKLLEDKRSDSNTSWPQSKTAKLSAFAAVTPAVMPTPPTARKFFSLCVLPKAQHSGIGRAFCRGRPPPSSTSAALRSARSGCPRNRRACEFFEAAGFTRDGTSRVVQCGEAPHLLPLRAPSHAPGQKILPIVKSAAVFNTPLRFYVDFIFHRLFPPKLAESRPQKRTKMPLYNIPLLGVYLPMYAHGDTKGNVSSGGVLRV